MLKLFLPDLCVKSVFEIKAEELKEKGIKGVITDLDNTLVAWDEKHATEEVQKWFEEMDKSGIEVMIFSNNNRSRVELFAEPLNRPYVYQANKPLKRAFKKAARQMGFKPDEIVVIGDQLLTDILGGNRSGFQTTLVAPIVDTDAKITKLNRKIEQKIMRLLEKRGLIKWKN